MPSADSVKYAKQFGRQAEVTAAQYYEKHGYKIERMNFTSRFGEIDIIARKGNVLVFAEVKARSENAIAKPREFVTFTKQQKIIKTAKCYLAYIKDAQAFVRFDVVEIEKIKGRITINIIENAFEAY